VQCVRILRGMCVSDTHPRHTHVSCVVCMWQEGVLVQFARVLRCVCQTTYTHTPLYQRSLLPCT